MSISKQLLVLRIKIINAPNFPVCPVVGFISYSTLVTLEARASNYLPKKTSYQQIKPRLLNVEPKLM